LYLLGNSLVFKEIAIAETLIHGPENIFRGQAVAHFGDERNIGLTGRGKIQNKQRIFGAKSVEELLRSATMTSDSRSGIARTALRSAGNSSTGTSPGDGLRPGRIAK
jgi:hypothetical protein